MKAIISKNILLASVLLVFGLSFSTSASADEYDFGGSERVVLPSEQTATDAGIFAGSDLFNNRPQRAVDDGDGGGFGNGGGSDCADCFDDAPIGNGMYVLMFFTALYGGLLLYRRRKEVSIV